ncbi:hypothetical protein N431DRAFT_496064 [Stipitochalara longipes BDJ]|nr:hypothetical protein N431DRAFT_496064 [Stipitochalara longipes BDJ]
MRAEASSRTSFRQAICASTTRWNGLANAGSGVTLDNTAAKNTELSEKKYKICTKIDTKERSIRKEEERIRRWRLEHGRTVAYVQPGELKDAKRPEERTVYFEKTQNDRKIRDYYTEKEARIQEMKMEVVVLRHMLSNTADENQILESTSASPSLTREDESK